MADRKCTCTTHTPQSNGTQVDTPCPAIAKYRLKDPDGVAYLCAYHHRCVRDMYEPGQIRKLRSAQAPRPAMKEEP